MLDFVVSDPQSYCLGVIRIALGCYCASGIDIGVGCCCEMKKEVLKVISLVNGLELGIG